MRVDDHLDEVYERLAATGPEFDGRLSNHGPMAADALMRMGHAERVDAWVAAYTARLEPRPASRAPIAESQWREPFGDPARLGDWLAFFSRQVQLRSWQELLAIWWPRLLLGAIAGAAHPLIRAGHAVRALGEADTASRRAELAQALGYWASRWQPIAHQARPDGALPAELALRLVPAPRARGGIGERLTLLGEQPEWPSAQARLEPVNDPAAVPAALDMLVDTTITRYLSSAHAEPVMLVHASTAPRAAHLALAGLPRDLWVRTYEQAWSITAAITAIYSSVESGPEPTSEWLSEGDIAIGAAAHGDEHVIKFTEVAIESHRRGNPVALGAALQAKRLIPSHARQVPPRLA